MYNLCPFVLNYEEEDENTKEKIKKEQELTNLTNILKFVFAKLNNLELQDNEYINSKKSQHKNRRRSIWAQRQSNFPGFNLIPNNKKSAFNANLITHKKRLSTYQIAKEPLNVLEMKLNVNIRESLKQSTRKRSR